MQNIDLVSGRSLLAARQKLPVRRAQRALELGTVEPTRYDSSTSASICPSNRRVPAAARYRNYFGSPAVEGATAAAAFRSTPRVTRRKDSGTKMIARAVAAIMPPITPVPIEWRLTEPAPVLIANGKTPKMNASEVMTIGRNLSRAASSAASETDRPSRWRWAANSTIRIAFFAARPISVTRPIWK